MLRGDNFVHGPQDSNWKWWVAFQQTPLIGPRRIQRLLDCFGEDLEAAWRAPASQLAAAVGDQIATRIVTTRESLDLDGIVAKLTALGLTVIAFDDSRYPQLLKETDAPPLVLYLLGTILPEDDLSIAVVGSRESTPYGRDVAREISKDLAAGGVTVVSGLARGIDGVAHEASLAAGGRSIAVLAGGLDWIYPAEHKGLARRISEQGALISEYPPGTRPVRTNFPARNRIMAGLASGVVIVEARLKSGTLITAEYAAHYNREVFAVPGSPADPRAGGTNQLLRRGATLVTSAADVIEVLAPMIGKDGTPPEMQETETAVIGHGNDAPLSDDALRTSLQNLLASAPVSIDDLLRETKAPAGAMQIALLELELAGRIERHGGGLVSLIAG